MEKFTDRIKAILLEKKLSQNELAKMSGIAEASLYRYINGITKPRLDIITNLAKALNISESYLIGESDEEKGDNYKSEIYDIVARNRNIMTDQDKMDIINMLYGRFDVK